MIDRIVRWGVLVLALCAAACHGSPMGKAKPWDAYAGEKLKVHGQDPATAGQVVWRALKDERSLRGFLARQGEPDSLEIQGGRFSGFSQKTIILYYTRRGMGAPHSIRLEPSTDGYVPRAPEPLAAPSAADKVPGTTGHRPKAASPDSGSTMEPPPGAGDAGDSEAPPAGNARPAPVRRKAATAEQRVNCPIDPTRADCQALCASDATQEWCGRQ